MIRRIALSTAGLAGTAFVLSLAVSGPAVSQDAGARGAQDASQQTSCPRGYVWSSRRGKCVKVRRGSH